MDKPSPSLARNLFIVNGLFWRSLAFSLGQVLSTFIFALGALSLFFLPFPQRYRFITQWSYFNFWWLEKTCKLSFQAQGIEYISSGPAIILCKHQSAWETIALQHIFPFQSWVLKRDLLWIPFFGWGLALLEPIAIDRKAGRQALNQILLQGRQRLEAGRWVVIFPEGTRIPIGRMGRFAIGGAVLAQATGYPVVPVAHNAGRYWPKGGFIKYPGVIKVVIGPPIETKSKTVMEINEAAYTWIAEVMKRIDPPRA
ncbi:1-acyl-sn-glycerol-3-phosphate acyltransferase [Candidatus Nitrosoglobus terrae]|uniref:1-acyl-sn-glycerol-3-phosphate acyltransferase n=1 Tax=Candidatus Nitrosoglobus terrae TaxID=1630141 RepID=A0A1Q2SK83_9GAMM|nr:1-acyl-sn-glycerol-3-phosphate acyltransferase [Candidatus Nitrosoglobus terrae]BAW79522.1 1-acyl-sn-glycerol-3-phosphate acyltransferase [Candidatus Nitrosoglobus terrae]